MRKLFITLTIVVWSMVIALPVVHGIAEGPKAVEEWFESLSHKKEKVTKLHFYLHDIVIAKNPTAFVVVQANNSFNSATSFGNIYVVDDALTVGPEPNSTTVGRAQGLYASTATQEQSLLLTFTLLFTDGKYNGSTLSLLGRDQILDTYREMPIVGGSGVFRLARGIVTASTVSFNTTTTNAVLEYNVIVIHY